MHHLTRYVTKHEEGRYFFLSFSVSIPSILSFLSSSFFPVTTFTVYRYLSFLLRLTETVKSLWSAYNTLCICCCLTTHQPLIQAVHASAQGQTAYCSPLLSYTGRGNFVSVCMETDITSTCYGLLQWMTEIGPRKWSKAIACIEINFLPQVRVHKISILNLSNILNSLSFTVST
jgi:hypothetical protein